MKESSPPPKFRFVDPHVHFYDMSHPTLYYGHWQPDEDHPVLGSQTRVLGNRNYLPEDFLTETSPHGTQKTVHVQAAIGSEDSVEETKWLEQAFLRCGTPNAIVGYVDLRGSDAEKEINRHMEYPHFRGVRDFSHGDYLTNGQFIKGFALLGRYGLVSSIAAEHQDMGKLASLARRFPDVTIVVDHAGLPQKRTAEYFQEWKAGMAEVSRIDNVVCKISGLGMADNEWSVESIRPYVESCIELFGCERSLFASNWPIDSLWSSYGKLLEAYVGITRSFSNSEKEQLFALNAEQIYGI